MTQLYDSNDDTFTTPDVSGWYMEWRSESSDEGWFKVEVDEIKDDQHAQEILEKELKWEWEGGHFYAYLKSYSYIDVEAEKKEKEEAEAGQVFFIAEDGDGNKYSIPENLRTFWADWEKADPYDVYKEWSEYEVA